MQRVLDVDTYGGTNSRLVRGGQDPQMVAALQSRECMREEHLLALIHVDCVRVMCEVLIDLELRNDVHSTDPLQVVRSNHDVTEARRITRERLLPALLNCLDSDSAGQAIPPPGSHCLDDRAGVHKDDGFIEGDTSQQPRHATTLIAPVDERAGRRVARSLAGWFPAT